MTNILIDARPLAKTNHGGIAKVSRLWIEDCISKNKTATYIFLTIGLKKNTHFIDTFNTPQIKQVHINWPNKIINLLLFLHIINIEFLVNTQNYKIDRVLLPNINFTGKITKPYDILAHDFSFLINLKWFNLKQRIWHRLIPIKKLFKHAEHIYCVSHLTAQDAQKLLNIKKEKTLYFKFNPFFKKIEPKKPDWLPIKINNIILLIGGSNKRKNIITALKAVSAYNQKHPKKLLTPIVIGGAVPFNEKNPQYTYLQAPKRISENELQFLYKNSLAFLYPSCYEGFGLPLYEAKQCKTPLVLSSTAGALTETAPQGTIFCNPTKPQDWLLALEIYLKTE